MNREQDKRSKNLARTLVAKRGRKNHSQESAAAIIGVSSMTLSRWERTVCYPKGRTVIRSLLEYLERKELP